MGPFNSVYIHGTVSHFKLLDVNNIYYSILSYGIDYCKKAIQLAIPAMMVGLSLLKCLSSSGLAPWLLQWTPNCLVARCKLHFSCALLLIYSTLWYFSQIFFPKCLRSWILSAASVHCSESLPYHIAHRTKQLPIPSPMWHFTYCILVGSMG